MTPLLPGIALCGVVAVAATAVNMAVPLVSAMLVAIVAGLILRNVGLVPASAEAGLKVTGKTILRLGVVLLGLRLSLPAVAQLGWGAIVVIAATVASVFLVTMWMGKLLGVPHAATLLTATGTAICGAAAVAGMSAVVRPERSRDGQERESVDDAAATAIASVTLFGTLAIVVLPVLVGWIGLGVIQSGVWVGASVHEVGQVVAAAGLISSSVLDVAVVAKLGRVALLAPLIALVGVWESRRVQRERTRDFVHAEVDAALACPASSSMGGTGAKQAVGSEVAMPTPPRRAPLVPAFVVGFLVAVALRSLADGVLPASLWSGANVVASFLLTMAMCAMGAGVNVRRLVRSSGRALLLGAIAGVVSAVVSLLGCVLLVAS